MAITVVARPDNRHYVGNGCATFTFNIDNIGTATNKRQFRWKLVVRDKITAIETDVTQVQAYTPKAIGNFDIDVTAEVSAVTLPVEIDPTFFSTVFNKQEFFLKYQEFEVVNAFGTCSVNALTVEVETQKSEIVNGGTQYWERVDSLIMSRRPEIIEICHGHTDYITLSTPFTVTIDGVLIHSLGIVNHYATLNLEAINDAFDTGLDESTVVIDEAGVVRTYKYLKKCCDNIETQVIFKESRGSWASMSMCNIQDIDFNTSFQSFVKNIGCNTPESLAQRLYGGQSKNYIEGQEARTYLIETDDSLEQRRWIHQFINSPQHILNVLDSQGDQTYVSATIDQSSYRTFNINDSVIIAIRFTIDQPFNTAVNV